MKQQTGQKFPLKMNVSAFDSLMKPLKILITAALSLFITGIFSGCEKNNDTMLMCRIIASASPSTGIVTHLSYNSDGKLNSATAGTTTATYEYTGNTVTITTMSSGTFLSKRIATLNAAGLAINVRTESNSTGTIWSNDAYEYSGEELIKSTNTSSTGSSPVVSTYSWFNQNLITSITGSTISPIDYYTDKPRQNGDYLSYAQLIQGYEIIRSKNLVKALTGSTFTYEFSSDGNISSVAFSSGNNTTTLNYQYECN